MILMSRSNKVASCKQCRVRKVRCDRSAPCTTCVRHGCDEQCSLRAQPRANLDKVPIPRREASSRAITGASDTFLLHPLDGSEITEIIEHQQRFEEGSADISGFITDQRRLYNLTVGALHDFINRASLNEQSWKGLEMPTLSSFGGTISQEERYVWQIHMASQFPRRSHCDFLVSYFFENINWIYQAVRVPSFMHMYERVWQLPIGKIDLGVASLLLAMISLSALYISPFVCESFGMDKTTMKNNSDLWFRLSRQALHVGQYEARPSLIHIQIFTISQLYWYAMKAVESLNS